MSDRIESALHYATPREDAPVWDAYDQHGEQVAEWWFKDEDDVRTLLRRLDADAASPSLFD